MSKDFDQKVIAMLRIADLQTDQSTVEFNAKGAEAVY